MTSSKMNQSENSQLHKISKKTLAVMQKMSSEFALSLSSKALPKNYLSMMQYIYRGRLKCNVLGCFELTVSDKNITKAVRTLNKLTNELMNSGYKVQTVGSHTSNLVVAFKDNERISFKITEGYKYHIVKDEECRSALDKLLYRHRQPVPTGTLTLIITAIDTNIRKSWTDGITTLEDQLQSVLKTFDTLVLKQKQKKINNVADLNKREKQLKISMEKEAKVKSEKSIYESALLDSQNYIAYKNLVTYLSDLEIRSAKDDGYINESVNQWIITARRLNDYKNPLSNRLKILNKEGTSQPK